MTPTKAIHAQRIGRDGSVVDVPRLVPEEVPVALTFNGTTHAVMMASPGDLEDFGLGFALTEAIIAHRDELLDIAVQEVEQGMEIGMAISLDRFAALKDRRRTLTGRTGCGLCGVDSLAQALPPLPKVTSQSSFSLAAIYRALDDLMPNQPLNRATGAAHAAAWVDREGHVQIVREDVGRHNALDKVAGALAWADADVTEGFAVITSRCSVEMVQKVVMRGIPMLVAVSAPTALACRVAERHGLTLLALARSDNLLALTHPDRLQLPQATVS